MKSARIKIGLLTITLIVCGCTQVSVQSSRETATLIEPHDAVAIVVSGEDTDFATNAEGCVSKALKEVFPTIKIISSGDFYRVAFPNITLEKEFRASTDVSVPLKDTAFRERIVPLGLRYLILIQGETQQKVEPVVGGVAGGLGAVTALGATWDRISSLTASIWDLKKDQSVGSIWVSASGKPWLICIGLGPFCAPLGAPAFTESEACGKFGEGVVKFLKGEELAPPLRIVLSPQLRPPTAKIVSGERLSLEVFDKRKQDFLGYWRDLLDYSQPVGESKIEISNSVETVVAKALRTGLSGLGFEVLDSSAISSPNLAVTIDKFEYWLARDVHVNAQMSVAINKGDQCTFKKTYSVDNLFDKPSDYPEAKWIEEKINAAISGIISKILADEDLFARLKE